MQDIKKYDVVFLRLPNIINTRRYSIMTKRKFQSGNFSKICSIILAIKSRMKNNAKLLILGDSIILPYIHEYLKNDLTYQTWLTVRHSAKITTGPLPNEHMGILVYTNGGKMKHSTIRTRYEYCISCDKTIKDYGGKKHLYHSYGTMLSDVWKDFTISRYDEFPEPVITRIRDLVFKKTK